MCGLIGTLGKTKKANNREAIDYVIHQYEDQCGRGMKGFGVVDIDDEGYVHIARATEPVKMMFDLRDTKGKHVFLHHRSPTSTDNKIDQTHPIEVEHKELRYTWLVMHNGTIRNATELKKIHEDLGYVYLTAYKKEWSTSYIADNFNDSESLAIELARYLEGVTKEMKCQGGLAFMAIAMNSDYKVAKVYIGTNGYGGISYTDNEDEVVFASEENGIDVKSNEAIEFDASYSKDPKTQEERLDKFLEVKTPIELKFGSILSPMQRSTPKEAAEDKKPKSPIGFRNKKNNVKEKEDLKEFSSFGSIVELTLNTNIGSVFSNEDMADHEALQTFNRAEFERKIIEGNVAGAEEVYEIFKNEVLTMLDTETVMETTMIPMDFKISDNPTFEEVIEGYQGVTRRRMAEIAKEVLPVFKVLAYCETVLTFAFQYKNEVIDRIQKDIDNADPDKALDEQKGEFDDDVAEIFPGKGKDDERESKDSIDFGGGYDPRRVTKLLSAGPVTRDDMIRKQSEDVQSNLLTLKDSAKSMMPEEVHQEAEIIADSIRIATINVIHEQLAKVTTIAGEEGEVLSIPYHFTKMSDAMSIARTQYEGVARIVKSVSDREAEAAEGTLHLNG